MVTQLPSRKIARRTGLRAVKRLHFGFRPAGFRLAGLRRTGWHIAMFVAALGFVLRALVPAGFMPDARAIQDGHIELTLCSPGSPVGRSISFSLSPDKANMSVGSSTSSRFRTAVGIDGSAASFAANSAFADDTSHPAGSLATPGDCPFGLMTAQAVIVPTATAVAVVASASFLPSRPVAARFASLPVQGPPLGSRAPPAAT